MARRGVFVVASLFVAALVAGCASAPTDCKREVRRFYQPYGGGGTGSFVEVPVPLKCPAKDADTEEESVDAAAGESFMARLMVSANDDANAEDWTPKVKEVLRQDISTGYGVCFDLSKLEEPWFVEEWVAFGYKSDVPITNHFVLTAPNAALGIAGGEFLPSFMPSRLQRYFSLWIHWRAAGPDSPIMTNSTIEFFIQGKNPLESRLGEIYLPQGEPMGEGPHAMQRYSTDGGSHLFLSADGDMLCTGSLYDFETGTVQDVRNPFGVCAYRIAGGSVFARFRFPAAATPELGHVASVVRGVIDSISVHCSQKEVSRE